MDFTKTPRFYDYEEIKARGDCREYLENDLGCPPTGKAGEWTTYNAPWRSGANSNGLHAIKGGWRDHVTGEHGSILDLCAIHHGFEIYDASIVLGEMLRIDERAPKEERSIDCVYDYIIDGALLFQVVRYKNPKTFKFRRPDPDHVGEWIWNIEGIKRILYHADILKSADQIIICGGEKDANRLSNCGFTATCCPMGESSWNIRYNQYIKGKDVVIIPDNDDTGQTMINDIMDKSESVAKSIRVVKLGMDEAKTDVSDWIDAGHGKTDLEKLISEAKNAKNGSTPQKPRTSHSWDNVTIEQVYEAIACTAIEPIVDVLASVADPPLPLEATLPKALALVGCAMTEPIDDYDPESAVDRRRGIDLARCKIMTARGQALNVWAMIVAESGSGKDVGNALDALAAYFHWHIGSSGSSEGLADAYSDIGNGLLVVSELLPFFDNRCWQSKARDFLTHAFGKGWFKTNLSRRGKGSVNRTTRFCYPNVCGYIQPETLSTYADKTAMDSGFLYRFLFSRVPKANWRPSHDLLEDVPAIEALELYRRAAGAIKVPKHYMQGLMDELFHADAPYPGHWRRLINEYGPRFAAMLSVDQWFEGGMVDIRQSHWNDAETLVKWFYRNAVMVLGGVEENADDGKYEAKLKKLHDFVAKNPGCKKSQISRYCGRGDSAKDRDAWLDELMERGVIEPDGHTFHIRESPDRWKNH